MEDGRPGQELNRNKYCFTIRVLESMAYLYLIFRLVAGRKSRHERLYLRQNGAWAAKKTMALRGTMRKMRTLAQSMKGEYPFLIIERAEPEMAPKKGSRTIR